MKRVWYMEPTRETARTSRRYAVNAFMENGSCSMGVDYKPWTSAYERTLNDMFKPMKFFAVVVRIRIPMWKIDGTRGKTEEDMAVFKTIDAAIEYIKVNEGVKALERVKEGGAK